MKEKRFSGYYWDPFLMEIKDRAKDIIMELVYGERMTIIIENDLLIMENKKDSFFVSRKKTFLEIFDENLIVDDFINRANVLLCFGDYSQDEGNHTNLLAGSRNEWFIKIEN